MGLWLRWTKLSMAAPNRYPPQANVVAQTIAPVTFSSTKRRVGTLLMLFYNGIMLGAVAVATSPLSIVQGGLFQYETLDYLCWVLLAFMVIRLLKSENPRWWLGIGAAIVAMLGALGSR